MQAYQSSFDQAYSVSNARFGEKVTRSGKSEDRAQRRAIESSDANSPGRNEEQERRLDVPSLLRKYIQLAEQGKVKMERKEGSLDSSVRDDWPCGSGDTCYVCRVDDDDPKDPEIECNAPTQSLSEADPVFEKLSKTIRALPGMKSVDSNRDKFSRTDYFQSSGGASVTVSYANGDHPEVELVIRQH
jgi:hypothetical protein